LVSETVGKIDAAALARIAGQAAQVVLASTARPDDEAVLRSHLYQHAAALSANADVTAAARAGLGWAIVAHYQANGQVAAAWTAATRLAEITGDEPAELLLAARTGNAVGEYASALEYGRRALAGADLRGDDRTRYRARLLIAQSLDGLGRYADADAAVESIGAPPDWMPPDERLRAEVDRATRLRMRGKFTAARESLEQALTDHPRSAGGGLDEAFLSAQLELATVQTLTGRIKAARQTAAEVVRACEAAGLDQHPLCLDAVGQLAEAEMTVDLTELRTRGEQWKRAEQQAREAHDNYLRTLGPANPRTLFAAYQRDLAHIRQGRPKAAFAAMSATEELVTRTLGPRHPLRFQIQYSLAQAYLQAGDFRHQHAILDQLLVDQLPVLGPFHPATVATEVDLGIAMVMLGDHQGAIKHIDNAAARLGSELDLRAELRIRVEMSKALIRLPPLLWITFARLWGFRDI
jgi:tetratricopeptide (TPR) repeat protein